MSDWSACFTEALSFWHQGQLEQAGRSFQQAIKLCEPANPLWRALLCNQLALLSIQMGHGPYAQEQWKRAQQAWQEAGVQAGQTSLSETLEWYSERLREYGFGQRGRRVLQLHQQAQPPLLEPSQAPPPDWDPLVKKALQLSKQGRFQSALLEFDRAKVVAKALQSQERSHLLALIYNAEALAAFEAGDYSQAGEAKQEAERLWQSLETDLKPYAGDTHLRWTEVLRDSGQETVADVFENRHQRRVCPLIDPWEDLQSGLQSSSWKASHFELGEDWKNRLESAFQALEKQQNLEAQRTLASLEAAMPPAAMRASPGALLLQAQALVFYQSGEFDSSRQTFLRAQEIWDKLNAEQRKQAPHFEQFRSLLAMFGFMEMSESLGERLCDPFLFHKPSQQLPSAPRPEPAEEEEEGDPRERWERQMVESWQLALKSRWEKAQRAAANAERVARLLGNNDLRVAYSLHSQALFCQASGDYNDAQALQEDAERCWKRGAHTPAARTAYVEFCDILEQCEWHYLSEEMLRLWDKPARSALKPAFLPLERLSQTAMQTMSMAPPEPEPDDGSLRLPTIPARPKPANAGNSNQIALYLGGLLILIAVGIAGWKLRPKQVVPTPTIPNSVKKP
jgi:hypothetical protein